MIALWSKVELEIWRSRKIGDVRLILIVGTQAVAWYWLRAAEAAVHRCFSK